MTTPRRVLVVDDDQVVRRIVGSTLERAGFLPVYAADGDAGWRALQEHAVELVITDRSMPNADGLELIRRIRASAAHATLPVIMLSGSLEGDKGHDARPREPTRFFTKFLSSSELLATVGPRAERAAPALTCSAATTVVSGRLACPPSWRSSAPSACRSVRPCVCRAVPAAAVSDGACPEHRRVPVRGAWPAWRRRRCCSRGLAHCHVSPSHVM